eukprot:COSAG02_NODE_5149_length_4589_cov_52.640757_5_plen_232_part_00
MAAAMNRHARERRRDPSGGLLTRSEFAEIYDHHSDGLWREAATKNCAAVCPMGSHRQDTLRWAWSESTVEKAPKKELLVTIQAVATDEWLREKRLHGRLRPLLKKTSAEYLRASYLALKQAVSSGQRLVELENEPEPKLELEPEPESEPTRQPDLKHTVSPWLTREQVQELAQIGDVEVALRGTGIPGGAVRGQLRRSQGRRNGKVLTEAGEIVWFSFADIESGNLLVLRS